MHRGFFFHSKRESCNFLRSKPRYYNWELSFIADASEVEEYATGYTKDMPMRNKNKETVGQTK